MSHPIPDPARYDDIDLTQRIRDAMAGNHRNNENRYLDFIFYPRIRVQTRYKIDTYHDLDMLSGFAEALRMLYEEPNRAVWYYHDGWYRVYEFHTFELAGTRHDFIVTDAKPPSKRRSVLVHHPEQWGNWYVEATPEVNPYDLEVA